VASSGLTRKYKTILKKHSSFLRQIKFLLTITQYNLGLQIFLNAKFVGKNKFSREKNGGKNIWREKIWRKKMAGKKFGAKKMAGKNIWREKKSLAFHLEFYDAAKKMS